MRWPGGAQRRRPAPPAAQRRGERQQRVEIDVWRRRRRRARRAGPRDRPVSPACTSPRWRSGSAMSAWRGSAPSTGRPSAVDRLGGEPPMALAADLVEHDARRRGCADRSARSPCAIAAADCACPDTSSTSITGRPSTRATSAEAPVAPGGAGAPSNRPIDASTMSEIAARAAPASARSSAGAIAQESRLTLSRPRGGGVEGAVDVIRPRLRARDATPRARSARSRPSVSVVLPPPERGAAIIRPRSWRPDRRRLMRLSAACR